MSTPGSSGTRGLFFRVSGRVQGVGYRAFARRVAEANDITGWVRNLGNGDVEGEAHGEASGLRVFVETLKEGPALARVRDVEQREIPVRDQPGFQIRY